MNQVNLPEEIGGRTCIPPKENNTHWKKGMTRNPAEEREKEKGRGKGPEGEGQGINGWAKQKKKKQANRHDNRLGAKPSE